MYHFEATYSYNCKDGVVHSAVADWLESADLAAFQRERRDSHHKCQSKVPSIKPLFLIAACIDGSAVCHRKMICRCTHMVKSVARHLAPVVK
jgi:hypothetical protein